MADRNNISFSQPAEIKFEPLRDQLDVLDQFGGNCLKGSPGTEAYDAVGNPVSNNVNGARCFMFYKPAGRRRNFF